MTNVSYLLDSKNLFVILKTRERKDKVRKLPEKTK
jgi:hypothetical protein